MILNLYLSNSRALKQMHQKTDETVQRNRFNVIVEQLNTFLSVIDRSTGKKAVSIQLNYTT